MPVTAATPKQVRRSARERLLAAADELFYAEGVQSVGIDRIIERAGVAKASLYHSFASKEELVGAYLEGRRARVSGRLTAAIDAADSPRAKILAMFAAQTDMFHDPGFRGCAFVAASTEAPPGGLVQAATESYRRWVRENFITLAREAGAAEPELLGRQLHLLYDGASLGVRLDRDVEPISAAARSGVEALLDGALRRPPKRSRS